MARWRGVASSAFRVEPALGVDLMTSACRTKIIRYICVVDFEATCLEDDRTFINEIIEFPIVIVDCHTLQVAPCHHTAAPHAAFIMHGAPNGVPE